MSIKPLSWIVYLTLTIIFPLEKNLQPFKNISDLICNNKFPHLIDRRLNIIISVRQASLINFKKFRKPENVNEPFSAKSKMGWTIFGPGPYLESNGISSRGNFVQAAATDSKNYNNTDPNYNHNSYSNHITIPNSSPNIKPRSCKPDHLVKLI